MPLAHKLDKKYTYADYLTWPDDERWEIIEGVPYDMSPASNTMHQSVSMNLSILFGNYLKDKPCKAFAAPFDVRFTTENMENDEDIETVVQPDLVVICDKKKIDEKGCNGAPDIAVEILSPSTAYKDEGEKLQLYEKQGVKEYWIVNPKGKYVMIYKYNENRYDKPDYYRENEIMESKVLSGFKIDLSEILRDVK